MLDFQVKVFGEYRFFEIIAVFNIRPIKRAFTATFRRPEVKIRVHIIHLLMVTCPNIARLRKCACGSNYHFPAVSIIGKAIYVPIV